MAASIPLPPLSSFLLSVLFVSCFLFLLLLLILFPFPSFLSSFSFLFLFVFPLFVFLVRQPLPSPIVFLVLLCPISFPASRFCYRDTFSPPYPSISLSFLYLFSLSIGLFLHSFTHIHNHPPTPFLSLSQYFKVLSMQSRIYHTRHLSLSSPYIAQATARILRPPTKSTFYFFLCNRRNATSLSRTATARTMIPGK